ncbi:MAG TPA: valine--tRNA ligase, partial [Bacteroidetes bacterium]|nr:valine--tRNA ligase [Bacteroidota bacterium]
PIVADVYVDPKFGTGAVKVTPAHDPNDFEIGRRHHLPSITVIDEDGKMNGNAGKYAGTDRFRARKQLVEELRQLGLLEKIEKHEHSVGHCQRCDTVIEPYLSEQWFVKIKPLAEPAMRVVKEGKVRFVPERWTRTYENWMENIRDWCISRQLWWGHRIPVYYCRSCGEVMVLRDKPAQCTACGSKDVYQDSDVLDTWFSAWLWPFSTMGWPEKTPDLQFYYPTDALVTGPDIIFFWVARMIMAGLEFMGDIPFRDVYINGIIRDEQGRKMSKSLGNGIDPLEMIEKYSADAVRFSLMALTSEGQDVNLAESKFEMGRNFSNKIWNAFRFLSMNREDAALDPDFDPSALKNSSHAELADLWILSRLNQTVQKITTALDEYRFNEYIELFYSFFWGDFCDWYLELIKLRLYQSESQDEKKLVLNLGFHILKKSMQLLHPVMPFISEEIWQKVRLEHEAESIMISYWPEAAVSMIDEAAENEMTFLQTVISAIRNIRSEMNVPPGKPAAVHIRTDQAEQIALLQQNSAYLTQLAKVEIEQIGSGVKKPAQSASAVVHGTELFIPLAGLIDIETEKARLQKEIDRLETLLEKSNVKLANQNFISRAPKEVVEKEQKKKETYAENLAKLKNNFASFAD